MGLVGAPIRGAGNPVVAALVAVVLEDLTSPAFDPSDPEASASGITIPGDGGTDEGVWRNVADDVRTAVRDALLQRGVHPPEGLILKGSRDGAQVSYYYGTPTDGQVKRGKYIGPKGSTGRVAPVEDAG